MRNERAAMPSALVVSSALVCLASSQSDAIESFFPLATPWNVTCQLTRNPGTPTATPELSRVSFTVSAELTLTAESGRVYFTVSTALADAASSEGTCVMITVLVSDCSDAAAATTRTEPLVSVVATRYPRASMSTPLSSARYCSAGLAIRLPSALYASACSGAARPSESRSVSPATTDG